MRLHKSILASLGLATLATLDTVGTASAEVPAPRPFTATYSVTFRGIGAGQLHMELRREPGTDRYVYETRADPSLLARLVVSSNAVERSLMEIDADGVRPLEWQLDDGRSSRHDDGDLRFDWGSRRVQGEVEGKSVSLPTEPGLQDRMSIQIAVVTMLLRGDRPGTIPLVDDERIKHYEYTRGDTETLQTELGELRTVIYESTREGSSRVSKVWHAPAHEYIPVRAEQIRKGKVETVMVLTALEHTEPGAPQSASR